MWVSHSPMSQLSHCSLPSVAHIHGYLAPARFCFFRQRPGRIQPVQAEAGQRLRRLGPLPAEEGKQEDVRIPEGIALVSSMGNASRTDGHSRVPGGIGAQQLEDVVAYAPLYARVALQLDIAVPPQGGPRVPRSPPRGRRLPPGGIPHPPARARAFPPSGFPRPPNGPACGLSA